MFVDVILFYAYDTVLVASSVLLQAYSLVRFLVHYLLPVAVFAYCYGRIFHTIRRQSQVVASHAGRSVAMATTCCHGNHVASRTPRAGSAAGDSISGRSWQQVIPQRVECSADDGRRHSVLRHMLHRRTC